MASVGRRAALVVVIGLATGMLTLIGQALLPDGWERLANSGAVWLAIAFGVGALMRSDAEAAVAGIATLLLAIVGYQVASSVAAAAMSPSATAIWAGTAVVGGPIFGIAGRRWRADTGRARVIAIALLGAVLVAEGVDTVLRTERLVGAGWVEIVVGVLIPIALGRTWQERAVALATMVPLTLLGLLAYRVIDGVFLAA